MARYISLAGYIVVLVVSWFVFEAQNIWAFNADRVFSLRLLFFSFAAASAGALILSRTRALAPVLATAAFVTTSAISRSDLTIAYASAATLLIVLLAFFTRLFGAPFNVR